MLDEVVQNVYRINGGGANVYLVFEFEGLTLIDTGLLTAAEPILQTVRTLGRQANDIKRIVLTHRHPDHVGSAAALKRATGAQVLAPQPDAHAIAEEPKQTFPIAPVGLLMRLFGGSKLAPPPCQVDGTLQEGQVLPVLGGLRVIATPGHTVGHCSLYQPERGLLFAGDALMTFRGKLRAPLPFLSDDYEQSCRTIRDRLVPLEIQDVLAGHGRPARQDVPAQFAGLARRYANL